MNMIRHFSSINQKRFLTSIVVSGILCMPVMAASSQQEDDKKSQTASPKESPDSAAGQNKEHPIRDKVIAAAEKTAEIAADVVERTRKGIHAATADPENEDSSQNSEVEDAKEAVKDTVDEGKEKADSIRKKAKQAYGSAKGKAKKAKEKVSDALD